jgi:AmmeMemoRadiSam system protein A
MTTVERGASESYEDRGSVLLALARAALEESLGLSPDSPVPQQPWLEEERATFITLRSAGELRGCIGTLRAHRPLIEDVRQNARAAAFEDPRFPPLKVEELEAIRIEVSLLSPLERLDVASESELTEQLEPGRDGVLLECGFNRGTFLPQVWEQLPDPHTFLERLKRKAGLKETFWSPELKIWRYRVHKWSEGDTGPT